MIFQANNLNSRNQERCVDSPCTFSVSNLCWPPPGWRKVDLQTGWSPVFFTACLAVIIISNFISLVFFWLDFWFLLTGRKMGKCWRCRWCKTIFVWFMPEGFQTFQSTQDPQGIQPCPRPSSYLQLLSQSFQTIWCSSEASSNAHGVSRIVIH